MKILYHHRTASKDGQVVHIEEMISAMREQGHEVLVVAPKLASGLEMGGEVGCWVQRLKSMLPKALYELLELAYSLVVYRQLIAAAKAFKPDCIYERYNLFLLSGAMASRRLGVPLLLEVNSPLVQERSSHSGGLTLKGLARWAEGRAWSSATTYVLPVTQVLAGHVKANGVPDERIVVNPNGINEAHFLASPLKLMEYLVLGKAVVALREPNLLEVLIDGQNAPMFDRQAEDGIERALTRVCADPAMRVTLGQSARATITRLGLTWNSNAARVVRLGAGP